MAKTEYKHLIQIYRLYEKELDPEDQNAHPLKQMFKKYHFETPVLLGNLKKILSGIREEHKDKQYFIDELMQFVKAMEEAKERGETEYFACKMFELGINVNRLNLHELIKDYADAIPAIEKDEKQRKALNKINKNKKIKNPEKEEREKTIIAFDKKHIKDDPNIKPKDSAKKMRNYIKTFDKENGLDSIYKDSNLVDGIYRIILKARKEYQAS